MSRHASAAAAAGGGGVAAGRRPGAPGGGAGGVGGGRRYSARYLYGSDHVTSAEEGTSRSRSQERTHLNRVRSVDRGRTKSRERHDSGPSHTKYHVKRAESREKHRPSHRLSIDPKLRNQIIEEAVRKARERQLSRNRDLSKSRSSHGGAGGAVERRESVRGLRRKSTERDPQRTALMTSSPEDRKSPTTGTGSNNHVVRRSSSRASAVRDRTPDDIEEWLQWRCYLNHQLSLYIVKGGNASKTPIPVDIMSVPEKLNKDTRTAIWSHAQREQPKTSLDSNAYIVYGIPRARVRHNGPNYHISHYAVPSKVRATPNDAVATATEYSSTQVARNFVSPRENAQLHGVAEKRPQSPRQQARPTSPRQPSRPTSPKTKSPPPVSPKPINPNKLGGASGNRPLSPGRERPGSSARVDRVSRAASPSASGSQHRLQPAGPANLREMYKKPYLRSMSEHSGDTRASSPYGDPMDRNNGGSPAPAHAHAHARSRPLSTSFLQREESLRYNPHEPEVGGRSGRDSPMTRLPSPKTIHVKRPTSPGQVSGPSGGGLGDEGYTLFNLAGEAAAVGGGAGGAGPNYVNVSLAAGAGASGGESHCSPWGCGPPPPTPPPLPPKSFHPGK